MNRDETPYAFVVPAGQRDPFATYELLEILEFGEVEIHRARAAFTAGGTRYPAGSWVIPLAQPYGAFAKTMLERQVYPDLRRYPGGPPIPPYDVTGHTLGLLMGVDVDRIDEPLDPRLDLARVDAVRPARTPMPPRPGWAYAVGPESNAGFLAAARLQAAGVRALPRRGGLRGGRAAMGARDVAGAAGAGGDAHPGSHGRRRPACPSTPSTPLRTWTAHRLKDATRIGLWRAANNMPGGWMMWLLEQYELNHAVVSALDFEGDLADKYDVIVLPSGTTRTAIVDGLSPRRHDESWRWAYGVGHEGWEKLGTWVEQGGTLVALGSAVAGSRELLGLPIEPVLPVRRARRAAVRRLRPARPPRVTVNEAERQLRDAFRSPAELARTLRTRVVDPTSLFYSPGTLLKQEHNPRHPVGYGMPEEWPVFLPLRPGLPPAAELRDAGRGGVALPRRGRHGGQRLAARGRVPARAGQRRLVRGGRRHGGHDGQPDRLPAPRRAQRSSSSSTPSSTAPRSR